MTVTSTLMGSCSAHGLQNLYVNYFVKVTKNLCNIYKNISKYFFPLCLYILRLETYKSIYHKIRDIELV
jgi:hypothetical protein